MNTVPVPYVIPNVWSQREQLPDNHVPARVGLALAYLNFLAAKESDSASGGDVGCPVIDGLEPTLEEQTTRVKAAKLLGRYFDGELPMNTWETARAKAFEHVAPEGKTGAVIHCPLCGGEGRSELGARCRLCEGGGKVLVQPR